MSHPHRPINGRVAVILFTLAALCITSFACSTPPKPKELVDFEAMRAERYTARIKQNDDAKPFLKASEDFYVLAMESYDDEDLDKTSEYSVLGAMRYRTAEAIAREEDAKARLTAANEKYLKFQDVRNERNDSVQLIEETIAALQGKKTLAAEVNAANLAVANEAEKRKLEQVKAAVQKAIDDANAKKIKAEGMKAPEYAAQQFTLGVTALKSSQKLFDKAKYNEAQEKAEEADTAFAVAIGVAEPKYKSDVDLVKQEELKQKLFDEYNSKFPGLVKKDGRGLVLTVDALFKPGRTEMKDDKKYMVDFIADLAKKYPDFGLLVEGHTGGGGARNITISQRRADAVKDLLLQRGLPAGKIQSAGAGGDKPLFKLRGRERLRNERVDIIFLNFDKN